MRIQGKPSPGFSIHRIHFSGNRVKDFVTLHLRSVEECQMNRSGSDHHGEGHISLVSSLPGRDLTTRAFPLQGASRY
jgi:hypothetical protein